MDEKLLETLRILNNNIARQNMILEAIYYCCKMEAGSSHDTLISLENDYGIGIEPELIDED